MDEKMKSSIGLDQLITRTEAIYILPIVSLLVLVGGYFWAALES